MKNGLFWYKDEAAYLRFREIVEDKAQLAAPYADWVIKAEELINEVATRGIILVKVKADPDEFIRWCNVNSCRPDSLARRNFAIAKVDAIIGNG